MTAAYSSFDLEGRVALVTGSTRGIGRAIADGLESAGATVIVHGSRAMPPAGTSRRYVGSDLAEPEGVDQLAAALSDVPCIDILVNNAGYEVAESATSITREDWDRTMNVNLLAPTRLVGALLSKLSRSASASVINITSIHEMVVYPGHLSYSVSKAGLAMATKTLAIELGPSGVRVNAIAPGVIETEINRRTIETVGRAVFVDAVPLRRTGQVGDVVGPTIFLASSASEYVTGTTLVVDGGYSINLVRYPTQ